jgi:hypothetical protein
MIKPNETKHKKWIAKCNVSPDELAENMGDLYYNSLADYLRLLADKIKKDSNSDHKRGRTKLASSLSESAIHLLNAAKEIDVAWKICKPYMNESEASNK